MSKEPQDKIIEGHEYDGIRELDNPLPKWWQILFYVTIVFAIGYIGYYEFLGGPTSDQTLEAELKSYSEKKAIAEQQQPKPAEVDAKALLADSAALADGQKQFGQFCASCHGSKGEGLIGPNLTDEFWLHSRGDYQGILVSIQEGFPTKGMPPWKDIVPKESQPALAVFVLSLKGTKPANGKAPQGEKIVEL